MSMEKEIEIDSQQDGLVKLDNNWSRDRVV